MEFGYLGINLGLPPGSNSKSVHPMKINTRYGRMAQKKICGVEAGAFLASP
jgi:hypothetical protein